jgi:hypothetical protein
LLVERFGVHVSPALQLALQPVARFAHVTSGFDGFCSDGLQLPLPLCGSFVPRYAEVTPLKHGGEISLQLWFTDVVHVVPPQPAVVPVVKSTNAAQAELSGAHVQAEQLAASASGSSPASNAFFENEPSQLGAAPVLTRNSIGPLNSFDSSPASGCGFDVPASSSAPDPA